METEEKRDRVNMREKQTKTERKREHDKRRTMSDCKVGCMQTFEAMCFLNQMYFYGKVSLPIEDATPEEKKLILRLKTNKTELSLTKQSLTKDRTCIEPTFPAARQRKHPLPSLPSR